MTIRIINVFTDNARRPSTLKTGMVCTLVETQQGLVMIDTGPGLEDYRHPPGIVQLMRVVTSTPYDPGEAAFNQVQRLGYKPEDVRHIILTHMHFDHCGGLPDFPWAKVHLHRREYQAFTGRRQRWTDMAYVKRHAAGVTDWAQYEESGEKWYDFDAICLPFEPEMWLVPLFGHTRGLCGVAVRRGNGWFFNAADAGAVTNDTSPAWLIRLVLGPHDARLRRFMQDHPEVLVTNSHMDPAWFEAHASI